MCLGAAARAEDRRGIPGPKPNLARSPPLGRCPRRRHCTLLFGKSPPFPPPPPSRLRRDSGVPAIFREIRPPPWARCVTRQTFCRLPQVYYFTTLKRTILGCCGTFGSTAPLLQSPQLCFIFSSPPPPLLNIGLGANLQASAGGRPMAAAGAVCCVPVPRHARSGAVVRLGGLA